MATIRVLTTFCGATDHFEIDLDAFKHALQNEYDAQGLNVTVEEVRKIRKDEYDYLLVDQWVPAESPIPAWLILAVIAVIALVLDTMYAVTPIGKFIREKIYEVVFPKRWYCPDCGAGPYTYEELQVHASVDHAKTLCVDWCVCKHCGMIFEDADAYDRLEKHLKECLEKPPVIPWELIIYGGMAIVALMLIREIFRRS